MTSYHQGLLPAEKIGWFFW